MTDDQKLFLVLAIFAGGAMGCAEDHLCNRARAEIDARLTLAELQLALRELADAGLIISWKPALASRRWKLTELGTLALREKGLA